MQLIEIITIIAASLIVAFTIGYAVYRKVKGRNSGTSKSSCGGSCGGCTGCGQSGGKNNICH